MFAFTGSIVKGSWSATEKGLIFLQVGQLCPQFLQLFLQQDRFSLPLPLVDLDSSFEYLEKFESDSPLPEFTFVRNGWFYYQRHLANGLIIFVAIVAMLPKCCQKQNCMKITYKPPVLPINPIIDVSKMLPFFFVWETPLSL